MQQNFPPVIADTPIVYYITGVLPGFRGRGEALLRRVL
jgi:hypothetical protein